MTLRRWRASDAAAFAAMNGDPQVMRFFPALLSRAESDRVMREMEAHFEEHGFGFWAVELTATGEFAGCAGLTRGADWVEAGCRLAQPFWRNGYATEAMHAAVRHAFDALGHEEVVAVTRPANTLARRVLEKLGFTHNPADDFYDPHLPSGHPLRPLLLYRVQPAALRPPVLR